jgi:hypothetical protein
MRSTLFIWTLLSCLSIFAQTPKITVEWNCSIESAKIVDSNNSSLGKYNFEFKVERKTTMIGYLYTFIPTEGSFSTFRFYRKGGIYNIGNIDLEARPFANWVPTKGCLLNPIHCNEKIGKYGYHGTQKSLILGILLYNHDSFPETTLVKQVFEADDIINRNEFLLQINALPGNETVTMNCLKK